MISALIPAFVTYVVMAASPGPGNLTIGTVAARHGRSAGLAFAAGRLAGGLTWAVLAATGISALLSVVGDTMTALKIACAGFLLWLSWRSARAAFGSPSHGADEPTEPARHLALARRGYAVRLLIAREV